MSCELCGGGDMWIKTCLHPRGLSPAGLRSLLRGARRGPGDRARRQGGDGEVRFMLALRQPQGVRGGQPWRTQERLLGDVRGVRGGGAVMGSEEPRLPPGYRLDRSDPDVWTLRRPEGWVVAHFSARGATKEAIEQAAWEDHEGAGEEEYP